MYRVNKYVDLLDRFVWTFIQSFLGVTIADSLVSDVDATWGAKLLAAAIAAAISAGKTVVAQNVGDSGLGDAVPGASVVETKPAA